MSDLNKQLLKNSNRCTMKILKNEKNKFYFTPKLGKIFFLKSESTDMKQGESDEIHLDRLTHGD